VSPTPPPPVAPPSTSYPWLEALGLLLSIIILWAGLRKPEPGKYFKFTLWALETLVLVVSVWRLKLLGGILFLGANLAAFLVSSVRLAMRHEDILISAAINADVPKETMVQLATRLKSAKETRYLGPIGRAELIRLLAERARTPDEIEVMARPLAMLHAVHKMPMPLLVEKIDRLLRRAQMTASETMKVADTLTGGTQEAAATFEEMLDAMLELYE